jgi:hypothetical protein
LPYTITEEDRAEDVSYLYYGTVDYVWAIYLANNIIDPYFEWPMTQRNFDRYIESKYLYACAECAMSASPIFDKYKTEFLIMLDAYDKNIAKETISFYEEVKYAPVWDYIELNANVKFLRDALTNFRAVLTANGHTLNFSQITDAEINTIIGYVENFVEFVFGEDLPQDFREVIVRIPDARLLKETFDVLAWTKSQSSLVRNKIHYRRTDDEDQIISVETYDLKTQYSHFDPDFVAGDWEPVRAYDYEFELNEDRRNIFVIDKDYIKQVDREMKELL